jgi:hypothetical protein
MKMRGTAIAPTAPTGTMTPSFIYVTPFLDEATRIKTALTELHFTEPTVNNNKGSKLE